VQTGLGAGKHVYVEKPLSLTVEQAGELVDLAVKSSYCSAELQTPSWEQESKPAENSSMMVDRKTIAASAFMMNHGHESWHPDPEFYYKRGGGPLFDMGPYYITAMLNLLGPVDSVTGYAQKSFERRTITSEPKHGDVIDVEVATHIAGVLHFEGVLLQRW
jgi:predicted dehydrogenase